MKTTLKDNNPVHLGNNVRRIREIIGMKQYTLAEECNWSQQQMSRLENSAVIDHDHLETIAEKLGVTSEFIKNFKEETAIYYIQNYNDTSTNSSKYNMSVIHHYTDDNLSELLQKMIKDEQQKSQTLSELSKAVLDLAEEVKKLKVEGK